MRKDYYLRNIKLSEKIILKYQLGKRKNRNARFQEGLLTLAWLQKKAKKDYYKIIENGLSYWTSLQNPNGSFPEIEKESFAATAFSSIAIAQTLKLCKDRISAKTSEKVIECLKKSATYLSNHSNLEKTNQEIAALKALHEMKDFFTIDERVIEEKTKNIFANKTTSGFFREDQGVDLGYASLSWEMLESLGFIEESREFNKNLTYFMFPDGTVSANFSRTIGWIILDQLEMAKKQNPQLERMLNLYIQADLKGLHSARHFLDERHTMTDSYRLCWAFDNCKKEEKPKANLPFEKKEFVKKFPEKILIIKKPKSMNVFYFDGKFSQSIWTRKGLIANLGNNLNAGTIVNKYWSSEACKSPKITISKNVLKISGNCKPNFFDKNFAEKVFLKAVEFFKKEKFEKTFFFTKNSIKIRIKASNGVERIPVLGSLSIKGFEKKYAVQKPNMVFYKRKDYYIFEKEFSDKLEYEIKVV